MASKSPLHARFAMDKDKEETGVLVNFGGGDPTANPPVPDIKVQIRRLKSRASIAAREELDKPHVNEIRRGILHSDVYEDLLVRQLAKGVIVTWEGVTDADGNPLPYTYENAYAILKALPEFRDEIFAISMERDVYKHKADAEAKENLSAT